MADTTCIPSDVARHAGLVMMQAASIASVLRENELICPFAVITKGESRQSVEFEAETQDAAVAMGWESLDKWRSVVDLWALAREGLVSTPTGKADVLVVAAWSPAMEEPVVFTQNFRRCSNGGLALPGPVAISNAEESELDAVADAFVAGIEDHPKGHLWPLWKAMPNTSLERGRDG